MRKDQWLFFFFSPFPKELSVYSLSKPLSKGSKEEERKQTKKCKENHDVRGKRIFPAKTLTTTK